MLSKASFIVAAVYAATGFAQTPVYTTTTLRTSTTSCPVICYDYVNACGQGYGGCVPRCPGDPQPTFVAPSCSKTTTAPVTTTSYVPTTTSKTTTTSCPTLCIDYVNTCGGLWGTCVPRCPGSTLPTFTPPPCNSPTTPPPTTTTTPPVTTFTTTSSCPTLCMDYLNSCGYLWGTCFPRCAGQTIPAITPPACSTRTTAVTPLPTLRPWEQCGGTTWTGRGVCPSGYTCSIFNEWYSQCVPV
ncbi:hypothetical protein TWF718_009958 [Orbilia javanica]|uniref:CBM1 domain-containing protein n=1 Tax=Orbilia javanica TaxID=47235 RepID=A0AAN8MN75_9PEZI